MHVDSLTGPILELRKPKLSVCPPLPRVGLSIPCSSLGNQMDIPSMEPKSGCCEFHEEACSASPLLGLACADFLGLWVKKA